MARRRNRCPLCGKPDMANERVCRLARALGVSLSQLSEAVSGPSTRVARKLSASPRSQKSDCPSRMPSQRVKSPELLDLLFDCLRKWSENDDGRCLGHGVPQGPEPSAFLAECFLFQIGRASCRERVEISVVDRSL